MAASTDIDSMKRACAERAVEFIESGNIVGLGTGSTARFAIDLLGAKVKAGLSILCIPTSDATAKQALSLGIRLTSFAMHPETDITIDGADEVRLDSFDCIKGLGGALLREKIVASASKRLVIMVDERKIVERLGVNTAVPVEVAQFGWEATQHKLATLNCQPKLRMLGRDEPLVTDSGNYILDCKFEGIDNSHALEKEIKAIVGVIENGLFIGLANQVVVASQSGTQVHGL